MSAIPTEKLVADKKRPIVETIDSTIGPEDGTANATETGTDTEAGTLNDSDGDAGLRISDELAGFEHETSGPETAETPTNEEIWGQTRDGRGAAGDLRMSPLLAGIEVTLSVEIGSHRLPLSDLMAVDPGQIFVLDRLTSEPVAILVNGKPFARGEVVAMDDRFGIRLVEMVGPDVAP